MAVNLKTITPTATRRFREAYTDEVRILLRDVSFTLLRYENFEGVIPSRFRSALLRLVGDRVQRLYVGTDLRSPFAEDGITPLSPYARLLNESFVEVITETVLRYQTQLRNTLAPDLFNRLADARTSNVVTELLDNLTSGSVDYITPYTWVDGKGLVLSDRIWNVSIEARRSVETVISRGIREGWGAQKIASELERYLIPDANASTRLPYGTNASYPAMRLARTEIARAMNEASLVSFRLNPYYSRIDVVRSGRGDPNCAICARHASINISGARVRPSYDPDTVPGVPLHPHCKCVYVPDHESALSAEQIRARLEQSEPFINPASGQSFIRVLLGQVLSLLLPSILSRLENDNLE